MAYQALYRKFRPTTFDDIVGQKHITQTLKNEILLGRIGHAYLFTGIRGTGKTTTAKVFSRAINCLHNVDGNPCNECEICKGILDGSILDVVEMDAASNNGVEDIREIREEVMYTAASAKYKIYIIDEVHMLSTGAFNALLKTLEEPPEHAVFILATTDVHKLPETILSRCQRFDFRRITMEDVKERLQEIAQADGAQVEEEALGVIAQLSEGSMRDAISTLDRCLAFGKELVTYQNVIDILGIAGIEASCRMIQHLGKADVAGALHLLDEVLSKGKSITQVADGLLDALRNVLVCKMTQGAEAAVPVDSSHMELLKETAEGIAEEQLIHCVSVLTQTGQSIRFSANPRILLELAFAKMGLPQYDQSQEALVSRVAQLEQKLEQGVPVAAAVADTQKKAQKAAPAAAPKKVVYAGPMHDKWKEIVGVIKQTHKGLGAALGLAKAADDADDLVILLDKEDNFGLGAMFLKDEYQKILSDAVEQVCGRRPRMIKTEREFVLEESDQALRKKAEQKGIEIQ